MRGSLPGLSNTPVLLNHSLTCRSSIDSSSFNATVSPSNETYTATATGLGFKFQVTFFNLLVMRPTLFQRTVLCFKFRVTLLETKEAYTATATGLGFRFQVTSPKTAGNETYSTATTSASSFRLLEWKLQIMRPTITTALCSNIRVTSMKTTGKKAYTVKATTLCFRFQGTLVKNTGQQTYTVTVTALAF